MGVARFREPFWARVNSYFVNLATLEDSAIGKELRQSPRLLVTTTAVAVAILALGLLLTTRSAQTNLDPGRFIYMSLALAACLYLGLLASWVPGMASTLGFRWAPKQGWLFWLRLSAAIGVFEFAMMLIGHVLGIGEDRLQALTWPHLFSSCINAPLHEEILYRMILCPCAVALVRPWGAIAISTVIFWFGHYVGVGGSVEYLVGGLVYAWFFIKSETILLPIVLHSVSNLFAFAWTAFLLAGMPSAPPVPAELKHPAEAMGHKSTMSDVATTIKFANQSKQTIKVYVLGYDGQRQFVATLQDGQSFEAMKTSPTHAWLITDEDDKPWYVYSPDGQPRTVEIKAPEKKQ